MRVAVIVSACLLVACQTSVSAPSVGNRQVIEPALAVMAAADSAPRGYPGTFGFTVRRADPVGSRFFLNSYSDYRDQRNLSVALDRRVLPALRERYGSDLRGSFIGRKIEADGVARRQRIDFTVDGKPTGKYYFQTHVDVTRPDQIRIVG